MILQPSLQNLCGKPGQLPSVENTLLAIKTLCPRRAFAIGSSHSAGNALSIDTERTALAEAIT